MHSHPLEEEEKDEEKKKMVVVVVVMDGEEQVPRTPVLARRQHQRRESQT